MATAPISPLVTVEEYLSTSYEYDMEYVDGVLVERAMPTYPHGLLQIILGRHLWNYRTQFSFGLSSDCRVELVPGSRYRVPDMLLVSLPRPAGKVVTTVPLAVIEIWSPDDRMSRQIERFTDYWRRGTREILSLNPEEFLAARFVERALVFGDIEHLELPGDRKVPFSTADIFEELREELSRQE